MLMFVRAFILFFLTVVTYGQYDSECKFRSNITGKVFLNVKFVTLVSRNKLISQWVILTELVRHKEKSIFFSCSLFLSPSSCFLLCRFWSGILKISRERSHRFGKPAVLPEFEITLKIFSFLFSFFLKCSAEKQIVQLVFNCQNRNHFFRSALFFQLLIRFTQIF